MRSYWIHLCYFFSLFWTLFSFKIKNVCRWFSATPPVFLHHVLHTPTCSHSVCSEGRCLHLLSWTLQKKRTAPGLNGSLHQFVSLRMISVSAAASAAPSHSTLGAIHLPSTLRWCRPVALCHTVTATSRQCSSSSSPSLPPGPHLQADEERQLHALPALQRLPGPADGPEEGDEWRPMLV